MEQYICDWCGEIITEARPQTVEWFGRLTSEIKEFDPLGNHRQMIRVVYRPVLAGKHPVELHFCSLSHAMLYLHSLPKHATPGDDIEIYGTAGAFSQKPLSNKRKGEQAA